MSANKLFISLVLIIVMITTPPLIAAQDGGYNGNSPSTLVSENGLTYTINPDGSVGVSDSGNTFDGEFAAAGGSGNANVGFTLIELMVVIAIIGILAAVAIPNFISYRDKAFCSNDTPDGNESDDMTQGVNVTDGSNRCPTGILLMDLSPNIQSNENYQYRQAIIDADPLTFQINVYSNDEVPTLLDDTLIYTPGEGYSIRN